jgi:hypothetical protein
MTSMQKRPSDDIDYQYPDEQAGSEADFDAQQGRATSNKKAMGILDRIPKKTMIIWVVVTFVLLAVYQVLTPSNEEAKRVPQPKAAQKQQATPAKTVVEANNSVAIERKPNIDLSPAPISAAGGAEMVQLETQLQGVSQEVTEIKETLSGLISTLEVMAGQVQELREAQQLRPSTFMPFKPKVPYYLKAVIVGRAWLESGDGNLITVKQGDVIPEYGTINKIDHNEGWVETSSGLVIGYGRNDS